MSCNCPLSGDAGKQLGLFNVARIFYSSKVYVHHESKVCLKCWYDNKKRIQQKVNNKYVDIGHKHKYADFNWNYKECSCVTECCKDCIKCMILDVPIITTNRTQVTAEHKDYIKTLSCNLLKHFRLEEPPKQNILYKTEKKHFKTLLAVTFEQFDQIVDFVCLKIQQSGVNYGEMIVNDDIELHNKQGKFKFTKRQIVQMIFHLLLFMNTSETTRKKSVYYDICVLKVMDLWKNGLFLMKKFYNKEKLEYMDLDILKKDDETMMQIVNTYIEVKHGAPTRQTLCSNVSNKYICIVDGWTIPTQSVANFESSYKLWSNKDKYSGVRLLVVCDVNGRLINVYGPFYCDGNNSDPKIYDKLWSHNIQNFKDKHNAENCFVFCDRAWRYSKLNHLKHFVTPCYKTGVTGEVEGNMGRLCTCCRWKIETLIGLFQNKFAFLGKKIHHKYIRHVGDLVKTMGAIIKTYHEGYETSPKRQEELQWLIDKMQWFKENELLKEGFGTRHLAKLYNEFKRTDTNKFKQHWKEFLPGMYGLTYIQRAVGYLTSLTKRSIELMSAGTHASTIGDLYLLQSLKSNSIKLYINNYIPRLLYFKKIYRRYSRGDVKSKARDIMFYYNNNTKFPELELYLQDLKDAEYDVNEDIQRGFVDFPLSDAKNEEINEIPQMYKILSYCTCNSGQRSICFCAHRVTSINSLPYLSNNRNWQNLNEKNAAVQNITDMGDWNDVINDQAYPDEKQDNQNWSDSDM